MIVEFIGLPCSGKTTRANRLAAALRKGGYTVRTRPDLEKTQPDRASRIVSYVRLAITHFALIRIVASQVWQQKRTLRKSSLSGFLHTLHQRRWIETHVDAATIVVLDEGLIHRGSASVFGYMDGEANSRAIQRYIEHIPLPDILVRLDLPPPMAAARIEERGRPERMEGLSAENVRRILQQTERAMETVSDHVQTAYPATPILAVRVGGSPERPGASPQRPDTSPSRPEASPEQPEPSPERLDLHERVIRLVEATRSRTGQRRKPIRVCMVTYTFPPLYGGSGAQALCLAKHMSATSVTVLTARHNPELLAAESIDGIAVRRGTFLGFGGGGMFSFVFAAIWHLVRHGGHYDVVHVHGAYWHSYPMIAAARLRGKPCVVKMTLLGTDDPHTIRQRRFGRLLHNGLRRAGAIVSVSAALSTAYRTSGLPAAKLVEIPNGVDTNRFCPANGDVRSRVMAQSGIESKGRLAVFVGYAGYRKGADILLDAWARVVERCPDAWLLLVGPIGDDLPPSAGAATIEDLLSRAHHVVATDHRPDVHEYLQAADVFVLPSRMEGLPNALMEAMSTGIAPIASNIGANAELIRHEENGLLFETGNAVQLADMILRAFDNDDERETFGRRSREMILKHYSIHEIADRYVALYDRLLNHPGGA